MQTEMMFYCDVDKGLTRQGIPKHGLQRIQSIFLPENLYYLECGCIYKRNKKTGEFSLLRPHVQRCTTCGVDVDETLVIKNKDRIYCPTCGEGKAGISITYHHKYVPVIIAARVSPWQEENDKKKQLRETPIQVSNKKEEGNNMVTEIMCWCTTDMGKHGLQKVQSVLVPENLYYLECGCIYEFDMKKDEFRLLRPYVQTCATCGRDVDGKTVIVNGQEVWCMDCSMGKTGTMAEYRHDQIPHFNTGYEVKWKNMNDKIRANNAHNDYHKKGEK